MRTPQAQLLIDLFHKAVDSANPHTVMPPFLPNPRDCLGKIVVIGAGKASIQMAQCLQQLWDVPLTGIVISPTLPVAPDQAPSGIEYISGSHPIPDESSFANSQKLLNLVKNLSPEDWVICLLSGGGSALLSQPLPEISTTEKRQVYQHLLRSGASISEINSIRRHISAIKGGRLAKICYPAQIFTYVISDVPGDQLFDIASGPTVGDPTTCAQALEIIHRYQVPLNQKMYQSLENGRAESLKPEDEYLQRCQCFLLSSPQIGLSASAKMAEELGYQTHILGDSIEGESKTTGKVFAGIVQQILRYQQPWTAPCILLSGGETTVTLHDHSGMGGRNVEYLLSLGCSLPRPAPVYALAADTDGIDGSAPIAGAVWYPDSITRALHLGLNPRIFLDRHDAHSFFQCLGDGLITGHTGTNINDFRALLIA
ncbi:MAG: glycerate kinase [Gammaproteobacteria bacterium]|nr:glycerate kinase [Gammaproteobacteria bacterium]